MLVDLEAAQAAIDELNAQLDYERTIRDLVEAERDEWRQRARVLEGQLRLKTQDSMYVVA